MTKKKSSLALKMSQHFISYFANNPYISPETYGQVILSNITESGDKTEYELIFEIPSIKSIQTRISLTQEIVDKLAMPSIDKLYKQNNNQLITTFDLEAPIHVTMVVSYPDGEDAKIIDVQSNVKLLKTQFKIHPTATTVFSSAIKIFGNGNPERLQFMLPYLQNSACELLDAIFSDPMLKKPVFKSWDVETFEPTPRDIEMLQSIFDNSQIETIKQQLLMTNNHVDYFMKQPVFKNTLSDTEQENRRQMGLTGIKDIADTLSNDLNINTRSIDSVASQLSKIKNNDIARVLKMSIPQSLIATSETIYEMKTMLELYTDSVKSLNDQDCQIHHVAAMKRLKVIIKSAINQLTIAEKMFITIIN